MRPQAHDRDLKMKLASGCESGVDVEDEHEIRSRGWVQVTDLELKSRCEVKMKKSMSRLVFVDGFEFKGDRFS